MAHILITENDAAVAKFYLSVLSEKGHAVMYMSKPEEVLACPFLADVDMVITGRWFPGMHGDELSIRLKEQYPDLLILIIASHNPSENKADMILTKVIAPISLALAVESLLRNHPEPDEG